MAKFVLWVCVSVLVWDFFNSPPGDSAATRAAIEFYNRLDSKGAFAVLREWSPFSNADEDNDIATVRGAERAGADRMNNDGRKDVVSDQDQQDGSSKEGAGQSAAATAENPPKAEVFETAIFDATVNNLQDSNMLELSSVPESFREGIKAAHLATGISLAFLVGVARQESNFNPEARAARSSASGMYQFIEQTWYDVIERQGVNYGLRDEATAIRRSPAGIYSVPDAELRKQILDLRLDADLSASMAAELARANKAIMKTTFERSITDRELYLAHFLGVGGAIEFIETMKKDPETDASSLFPKAAYANHNVFYNSSGAARSVHEVYDYFQLQDSSPVSTGVGAGGGS